MSGNATSQDLTTLLTKSLPLGDTANADVFIEKDALVSRGHVARLDLVSASPIRAAFCDGCWFIPG